MRKVLRKIIALLTMLMVVGITPIYVGVEATSNIVNEINSIKTTEENVELGVSINGKFKAEANVGDKLPLQLSAKVLNTGYLKDIVVSLKDSNYVIDEDSVSNVKSINGSKIYLNEVNAGEVTESLVNIHLAKTDYVEANQFDKESSVVFNAIYVNEAGKEKEVNKEFKLNVKWNASANEIISQELTRYIQYNNNNTLVSFKITDGIKDNLIPVLNKVITINAPRVNNMVPEKVVVIGEGIEKEYKDGVITIKKTTEEKDGKIKWDSQDEYVVILIYNTTSDETTLKINTSAEITTINDQKLNVTSEDDIFEIDSEVGTIIDTEALMTKEISKGYLYTNLNRENNKLETNYNVDYKVNVGLAELVDKIVLAENDSYFGNVEVNSEILTKKVSISLDELKTVLGEEGTITVKDSNGEVIDTLNKEKNEIELNTNRIIIETSKPITEGNLNIIVNKAISSELDFSKEQLDTFETFSTNITVDGIKEETVISSKQVKKETILSKPTSKAIMSFSQKELSTVRENEDIAINVVLKTNEITDALYTNPIVEIELPEQVKYIEIKDANLIYGNEELVPSSITTEGNKIIANIDGVQTVYADQATSVGPIIRLVANIVLDNLAPSSEESAKLSLLNQATGEVINQEVEIDVVAPEGFITTDTISIGGVSETAINENRQITIDADTEDKDVEISSSIINNLGESAKNLVILGRIPAEGNKTIQENVDLGSTLDTTLSTTLSVNGVDSTIYYSTSEEEGIDGNWNTEFTQNAKSYKIVANSDIEDKQKIDVNYNVSLPSVLSGGMTTRAIYGVYYSNNATEGVSRNLIQAKAVGIETQGDPEVSTVVRAYDYKTGDEISEGQTILSGRYLKYVVEVNNSGKVDLSNVEVKANLVKGLAFYEIQEADTNHAYPTYTVERNEDSTYVSKKTIKIDSLKAGAVKKVEFYIVTRGQEGNEVEANFTTTIKNSSTENGFTLSIAEDEPLIELTPNIVENIMTGQELRILASIGYKKEMQNVQLVIKLAKGLKYVSLGDDIHADEIKNIVYDENNNTVSMNIDKIKIVRNIEIITKVNSTNDNMKVSASATAKIEEKTETLESNVLTFNAKDVDGVIRAKQTTNITDGSLIDTDEVEYYIDITNNSEKDVNLNLIDDLPSELSIKSFSLVANGQTVQNSASNHIDTRFDLLAGQTARATVVASVKTLPKNNKTKLINKPTITDSNGKSISINTIELSVTGTGIEKAQEDNYDDIETEDGTYKIVGIAWQDNNFNGKRDENEAGISGIQVILVNSANEYIAQDSNGKNLTTTTDGNGLYVFTNVKPGSYVALAMYDTNLYTVSTYKAQGVTETENSDYINSEAAGRVVAITDVLSVNNSNIYNINLGLVLKNRFDLSIDKTIKKITDINSKKEVRVYEYDNKFAKIELSNKDVEYSTLLVEYSFKIKNEGSVAGYARSIIDYIPKGMVFNSELNSNWFIGQDGNGHNTSLANTLINPGETKEITLVLTKQVNGENLGTTRNTAEIETYYNDSGLSDIDSTSANKVDGEDDISSADMIVLMSTGKEAVSIIGISLGSLTLIALAVYVIKKYIINKMDNNVI